MKSVSGKFLCKVVEQRGWNLKRITGSHYIYVKRSVNAILSIPVHGNRDLPIGTLKSIIAVFSRVRGNKILERLTVKDSNTPHSCDYRYMKDAGLREEDLI